MNFLLVRLALVSLFFSVQAVAGDYHRVMSKGTIQKFKLLNFEKMIQQRSQTGNAEELDRLADAWLNEFESPQEAFRYFFFEKKPEQIGEFLCSLFKQGYKRIYPQAISEENGQLINRRIIEFIALYKDTTIRYIIEHPDADPIGYFGANLMLNAVFLESVITHQNSSQLFEALIRGVEVRESNRKLLVWMIRNMCAAIKSVDSLPLDTEHYEQIEKNYFVALFRLFSATESDSFYNVLKKADLEFRDYSIVTKELHTILFFHFWKALDDYLRIHQEIQVTYFMSEEITKTSEKASRKLHLIEDYLRQIVRFPESARLFKQCMTPLMEYAEQGKQLPPFVLEFFASHPYTDDLLRYPQFGSLDEPNRKDERTKTYNFLKALDGVGMLRLMLAKPMGIPDGRIRYGGLLEVVLHQFVQELQPVLGRGGKITRDALSKEFIPIIQLMLDRGADINVSTASGEPLWYSFLKVEQHKAIAQQWPKQIYEHMVNNCADIFAAGPDGTTIFALLYSGIHFPYKKDLSRKKFFMRSIYDKWRSSQKSSHEFFSPSILRLTLYQRAFFIDFFGAYPDAISLEVVESLFFRSENYVLDACGKDVYSLIRAAEAVPGDNNYFDMFLREPGYFLRLAKLLTEDLTWLKDMVGTLCQNPQFNINYQNDHGDTFLHVFARSDIVILREVNPDYLRSKKCKIINTFFKLGADLDRLNNDGQKVFDICPALENLTTRNLEMPSAKRRKINNL